MNEVYRKDNETKLVELESQYKLRERQQENTLLRQQQQATEFRNRAYLMALGVALLVMCIITLLALRLRRANAKLAQIMTEVQQLANVREQFIAIVAHDLRKPLMLFRGMGELVSDLIRQRAYADIQTLSRSIDLAGTQLEQMLNNLLSWALAQREAIPYNPAQLRVSEVLHQVADLYAQLIHYQPLTLTVECPENLTVWADSNGLALILRNLIDNALRAVGTNGQIQLTAHALGTGQTQISVQDNGRGIDPIKLTLLRQVFAGEVTAEPGQNGLGMGLVLIRDFVFRNGGTINIVSEPHHGTTFQLTLPARSGVRVRLVTEKEPVPAS